jgi:transitional endoplasmic reticulum ATPase
VRAHFIHVNGPEVIHKFYGESEAKLRQIFEEAQGNAPSIIFLDEFDALAPKRAQVIGDVEKRVVAQLLALMDGLVDRGAVVVIGATNMPEMVDPALRRPGRFDREITIGVPDRAARRQILGIHSRRMPLRPDVELDQIAEITHGYVGADLEVLCKEAGMVALRRLVPQVRFDLDLKTQLDALAFQITREDFLAAFKVVEPTSTREFLAERPRVRFSDIGGLTTTKQTLTSIVHLVRAGGEMFGHTHFNPPKGILLTGASGTGKTLLARALAGELGLTLITVDQTSLLSKWVGESEKGLREVFKRAKQASPCILFFDEIESLVPARVAQEPGSLLPRLVSQLFRELDDLHGSLGVVVLGATNRPELMEPALLRAGRFDYVLELPLPNRDERRMILEIHSDGLPLSGDVDFDEIARQTEGWTGASLELVCKKAAILAFEECRGTSLEGFRVAARHLHSAQALVCAIA